MSDEEVAYFKVLPRHERKQAIKEYQRHDHLHYTNTMLAKGKKVIFHSSVECFVAAWKRRGELE